MAVKIRLARHGSKKRPYYRVVVADSRTRRDGRPIEEVGRYNPMTTPKTISLDLEKIADWQSKGAQLTDAVAALVKAANEGEKTAAAPKKSKKQLAKEAEDEEVGRYNPMTTPKTISLDLEKIADWQSKGAQLTDAVAALVKAANEGDKTAAAHNKSKKQLAKEAEEAARKAEEEAAAAAEASEE